MRALTYTEFGGPEVLHVVDVPRPEAGDGQVVIAVRAAAVNPFDAKQRAGAVGGEPPAIPGYDAAGVIEATGERVFGQAVSGAYAEYAVLANWAAIPDDLSFEEAAGYVTPAETAVRSLELVGVGDGTTVVIAGASGGVGSAAVQFALARGARVIGTASDRNRDYVRDLGAEVIGHDELGSIEGAVDAGVDTAGKGSVPQLIELTGDPAKVVTIADFGAGELGVHVTGQSSAWHALAEAADLHRQGRFSLPVAQALGFEQGAEAHRLVEQGSERGKIILVP